MNQRSSIVVSAIIFAIVAVASILFIISSPAIKTAETEIPINASNNEAQATFDITAEPTATPPAIPPASPAAHAAVVASAQTGPMSWVITASIISTIAGSFGLIRSRKRL